MHMVKHELLCDQSRMRGWTVVDAIRTSSGSTALGLCDFGSPTGSHIAGHINLSGKRDDRGFRCRVTIEAVPAFLPAIRLW